MANTKVTSFSVQGNRYGLEPDLTFDTTPTAGSTNPVTSNGIYMAISAAAIGTDISVGRTDGSQIGYCSIAYGSNIIASADYSIVFGKDNKCFSQYSIVSGSANNSYGYNSNTGENFSSSNIVFGRNSTVCGNFNGSIGDYNKLGTSIRSDVPESYETLYGYFNPVSKKLYYDENQENEHEITFDNQWNTGSLYIVDLTNTPPNRVPGDIYEYHRSGSSPNYTTTVKKMDRRYVKFTDMCHNFTYVHMGVCYYDAANDRNYRSYNGSSYSDEILDIQVAYGMVFFDLVSDRFVLYCGNTSSSYPLNCPKWLKIHTYKGFTTSPEASKYGRFAYVYSTTDNTTKTWHVYSSPDYGDMTDITTQILDGEIVIDISTGKGYLYRYNFDHILSFVKDAFSSTNNATAWYSYAPAAIASMCLGISNYTTGKSGSIVCGTSNKVTRNSEGSAVFGLLNTLEIGNGYDQGASFIAGHSNVVKSMSDQTHSIHVIGDECTYNVSGSNDRNYIFGNQNELTGESTWNTIVVGYDNESVSITESFISGHKNRAFYQSRSDVIGYNNELAHLNYVNGGSFYNYNYTRVDVDDQGIYTGDGISYDAINHVYTFPTDSIFRIYEIPEVTSTTTYGVDRSANSFSHYAVSTDGRTLTTINFSAEETYTHIYGTNNKFIPVRNTTTSSYYSGNKHCYIIGNENILRAGNAETIGLIGYGLNVTFKPENTSADMASICPGAVYVGSYNSMSGLNEGGTANSGQFVVGIGTGENDRKNGLIVYNNGNITAPNAPATYQAIVSAGARYNPMKSLVTWEQLNAISPSPGNPGKPNETILQLGTSGWSSLKKTIALTGVSASSVVTIFPSGNPHAFYTDEIYLDSQGTDELTFGCSVVPSVDISVKVVYWK